MKEHEERFPEEEKIAFVDPQDLSDLIEHFIIVVNKLKDEEGLLLAASVRPSGWPQLVTDMQRLLAEKAGFDLVTRKEFREL